MGGENTHTDWFEVRYDPNVACRGLYIAGCVLSNSFVKYNVALVFPDKNDPETISKIHVNY